MEAEEVDCGAHAALTIEAFRARGINVLPVQLVQRQERHHLLHFHGRWSADGASPDWAGEGAAYHEACATLLDGRVEVWDATVSSWLSPDQLRGVRSIAAVRIGGTIATGEVVTWRGLEIPLGEWASPAGVAGEG
jgi:hypothetical protein